MNNYTSIKPATKEKKSATKNSIMRVFLVAVAILLQCYFLYLVLVQIEKNYEWVDQVARMAALLLCIALFSIHEDAVVYFDANLSHCRDHDLPDCGFERILSANAAAF